MQENLQNEPRFTKNAGKLAELQFPLKCKKSCKTINLAGNPSSLYFYYTKVVSAILLPIPTVLYFAVTVPNTVLFTS